MNKNALKFFLNPDKILKLISIKLSDEELRSKMSEHYSRPKGFVGRHITYAITYDSKNYGFITGGSPTLYLPGRNEFFNLDSSEINDKLVNNIFYHIEKIDNSYPLRNFTVKVLREWRKRIREDFHSKYGVDIIGYESLVELPRSGEIYIRDKWTLTGQTKGMTCKRISDSGNKTEMWGGKRIWDRENLKPKLVFCRYVE